MKTKIRSLQKATVSAFCLLTLTISVKSQHSTHQDGSVHHDPTPYIEYSRELKDTVLMNTDHFYITLETGFGFNLGPTVTTQAGNRFETNAAPFDLYDFSMSTPTKFNLGYAYKSHHFEGSFGMMRERLNVSILDANGTRIVDYRRNQTYGSLTFRYFYRFPIRIPRLKMMIGGEIGGAYRPDGYMQENAYSVIRDTGYTINGTNRTNHNFQLVLGVSACMDIKLCKNVSLSLLATLQGSPLRGTEYLFNYTYQGSTNQTAQVYSTLINLNLNAGVKIDLFCHKKKRETYDKYQIQDPYRDK